MPVNGGLEDVAERNSGGRDSRKDTKQGGLGRGRAEKNHVADTAEGRNGERETVRNLDEQPGAQTSRKMKRKSKRRPRESERERRAKEIDPNQGPVDQEPRTVAEKDTLQDESRGGQCKRCCEHDQCGGDARTTERDNIRDHVQ